MPLSSLVARPRLACPSATKDTLTESLQREAPSAVYPAAFAPTDHRHCAEQKPGSGSTSYASGSIAHAHEENSAKKGRRRTTNALKGDCENLLVHLHRPSHVRQRWLHVVSSWQVCRAWREGCRESFLGSPPTNGRGAHRNFGSTRCRPRAVARRRIPAGHRRSGDFSFFCLIAERKSAPLPKS